MKWMKIYDFVDLRGSQNDPDWSRFSCLISEKIVNVRM